jgi:uncharacterized membrane protein/Mg-chelatase subunit ChlD
MLVFNSPWYLLLLLLLPPMWWFSYRSLSGLGQWRRLFALALRTIVLVLIVGALAEMQYQRTSDRLTVIYLLDQSLSIPEERRAAMIRYTNASIQAQRKDEKKDRAGVIVFGKNAEVELPPVEFNIELVPRIESLLDPEFSNLAGAMQRAMSMFPHDAAKRIVLVTDGNQNIGDALEQARAIADAGVSIDVLPVPLERRSEVAVEKVALPVDVRRDQPFELRVVLNHAVPEGAPPNQTVSGRVRVVRKAGDRETTIAEGPVTLAPGKHVVTFRETISQADFYTYEAHFTPDNPADDPMQQNNNASAFTHVRGKGQVLFIEDWEAPGEFDYLVERLRNEGLEVVVQPSNRLFSSLPELQRYDTIVLANVPRSSGQSAETVSTFSDAQIQMLVRNTEELGCGLIMLGGPNSFGAGGWTNTELEKAMPVEFQIKSSEAIPIGALVLNMHASEIPQANYWQKVISQEAIKALGPRDYCGLISFTGQGDQWLWGASQGGVVPVGPNRATMLRLIDTMNVGDMPAFDPGMKKAAVAFAQLPDAAIKHMVIISDGDPSDPTAGTIQALKAAGVTVSTVAVGSHGPATSATLQKIATQLGGKYYEVNNANVLPKIFQREARRVARPLLQDLKPPVSPRITVRHEIVQGLEDNIPAVSGFVLTTVKENSLVEVVLRSPTPVDPANSAILATWTYGLGKAVAFTTDAGKRWANEWTGWDQYDRFFSQMVRWSMRPSGDTGNFTVATDVVGGKTRVIISALDKEDQFINDQAMNGTVLGPNMESIPLDIEQTAPGRYVGEFDSSAAGSYMIMVTPGAGQAMVRTGVNIGYSQEFRDRETNLPLLESLARLPARGGEPGNLLPPLTNIPERDAQKALAPLLAVDPFRRDLPKAVASQDIWHLLVVAGSCLFLADVFVRRVQINFLWLLPIWTRALDILLRRERQAAAPETMQRLRSRKAEVDRSIESRRATARFEPDAAAPVDPQAIAAAEARPTAPRPPQPTTDQPAVDQPKPDDYTSRLLKAKKQVWKDRNEDRGLDQ